MNAKNVFGVQEIHMILPINGKYRLTADRYSWAIQERVGINRKTGEIRWEGVSWCPTLHQALKECHQRMVRTSDAQTLAEALEVAEKATATIIQALSPTFDIRERKSPAIRPGLKDKKEIQDRAAV